MVVRCEYSAASWLAEWIEVRSLTNLRPRVWGFTARFYLPKKMGWKLDFSNTEYHHDLLA